MLNFVLRQFIHNRETWSDKNEHSPEIFMDNFQIYLCLIHAEHSYKYGYTLMV